MTSLCVEWCYASSGPSDYQHHLGLLHIYDANKIKQKRIIVAIYGICYAACKCMQYVCVCVCGDIVCICVGCVYWVHVYVGGFVLVVFIGLKACICVCKCFAFLWVLLIGYIARI